MKLVPGLYEQLVTKELRTLLGDPEWKADLQALGKDAAHDLLARHVFPLTGRSRIGHLD